MLSECIYPQGVCLFLPVCIKDIKYSNGYVWLSKGEKWFGAPNEENHYTSSYKLISLNGKIVHLPEYQFKRHFKFLHKLRKEKIETILS